MLTQGQITDNFWNTGKSITDNYAVEDAVVMINDEDYGNEVKIGYWFTYRKQHVEMARMYEKLPNGLLHARDNSWRIEIEDEPVETKFKTIPEAFEFLIKR